MNFRIKLIYPIILLFIYIETLLLFHISPLKILQISKFVNI